MLPFGLHLTLGDSSSPFISEQLSAPSDWAQVCQTHLAAQTAEPHLGGKSTPSASTLQTAQPGFTASLQSSSQAYGQQLDCPHLLLPPGQPNVAHSNALQQGHLVDSLPTTASLPEIATAQAASVQAATNLQHAVTAVLDAPDVQQQQHDSELAPKSLCHAVTPDMSAAINATSEHSQLVSKGWVANQEQHSATASPSTAEQEPDGVSEAHLIPDTTPDMLVVEDLPIIQQGDAVTDAQALQQPIPRTLQQEPLRDVSAQLAEASVTSATALDASAAVDMDSEQLPAADEGTMPEAAATAGSAEANRFGPLDTDAISTVPVSAANPEGPVRMVDAQRSIDNDVSGMPDTEEQGTEASLSDIRKLAEDVIEPAVVSESKMCNDAIRHQQDAEVSLMLNCMSSMLLLAFKLGTSRPTLHDRLCPC